LRRIGDPLSSFHKPCLPSDSLFICTILRNAMSARHSFAIRLLCVLALACARPARAQQPIQPKPQAPNLTAPVTPLCIQRGTSVELTLSGANLSDPLAVWTSVPAAKATIPTDANNGKDNAKLRVRLDVPHDAPLGFHALRLATSRGMSNLRLFCIDELPAVTQQETNRNKATPQIVPVTCVVLGRVNPETSDWYKITVPAHQRLSFEVFGRRLGSAFDPQLTLHDARTGKPLPGAHSNDSPGCQTDPRLTYVFKEAGDYLIEVRDVLYRGGPDYQYCLRLGDSPCATAPVPMAVKRGAKVSVGFAGTTVDGVPHVDVQAPSDPSADTVWVTPRGSNGLYGWPVALAVTDLDEIVEQEPNNDPAHANRIPIPCGVTGRFQEKGDIDHYVFAAKKGQRLVIDAQTQELYSPTEVYMTIKDAKGGQLAAMNPMAAPHLDFTAPADGDFTLTVEHLYYWGGPAESYHLTVKPYEPGFSLDLRLDRWDAPQGGTVLIPVMLSARRDYKGPIEVSVIGPPGVSGQATISANAAPVPPPPAAAPPTVMLPVTIKPDVPVGAYTLLVRGKATIDGKTVIETASVRLPLSQSLAGLPYPPRSLNHLVGFAVTPKPPFTLAAKFDAAEYLRGGPAMVTVTATRDQGFVEDIALTAAGQPANVAPALKNIPKGQNEAKGQFTLAANAPLGQFPITIVGTTKHQGRDFSSSSLPATLIISPPFTLAAPAIKLAQGGKVKLKVTATRKAGYQGPITLEVRSLPANVTAAKATIADGKTDAEIEISAASAAAVGSKADVNVLGTAVSAANQQNASPNFTLSVELPPAPFALKVDPTPVKLAPGDKAKVKVTAERKDYAGPIEVEIRNLPAGVTAPKATIAKDQNMVEIEVTAAATAQAADKADVEVAGTIAGHAPAVSPKFTVSVVKK
jgi:hypothetical protein